MRSHHEHNHKGSESLSEVDIHQIYMLEGHPVITKAPTTFNGQPLYKIEGEVGLYTVTELNRRLVN